MTTNWWGGTTTTHVPEGPARARDVFWSHDQDSLYTETDPERPNSVDWGNVTPSAGTARRTSLTATGDCRAPFPTWIPSPSRRTYTEASQKELDAARREAETILKASAAGTRTRQRLTPPPTA